MEELLKEIKKIKLIDSHEHCPKESDYNIMKKDFIDLLTPYVCDNLSCSGMDNETWRKINDKTIDFTFRFKMLEPYLENIKFTTYFLAVKRSVKECFNEEEISLASVLRINEKINVKTFEEIFKENHIEKAMTFIDYYDVDYFNDSKLIIPVPTVSYITPKSLIDIEKLEQRTNIKIKNLDDLGLSIEIIFEYYYKNKLKNIKIGGAYNRVLDYHKCDVNMASIQLSKIKNGEDLFKNKFGDFNINNDITPIKDLDNYVIYKCVELAEKYDMNVIIHTGIHAWNSNNNNACRANVLLDIIRDFNKVNFILLHLGYPYVDDTLLLCKYYKNVFLDFAWVNILDRVTAVNLIKRVIELLPQNKVVAFGGDYCLPVNTIGHLNFALENLAMALQDLINNNIMTKEESLSLCKKWLYDNPKCIYKI